MALVPMKPVPETVSVNAAEPALNFAGLIEVIAGAGVVGELVPEFEPPLEHPASETRTLKGTAKRKRPDNSTEKRRDTRKDTEGNPSIQQFDGGHSRQYIKKVRLTITLR